ncbi:hypothetical protein CVT24_010056 [Panaeolus cyanescens]|uniref:Uncharacterized protein n=1 Tax=Panaeolus cyanescens TaxID=181874 RepID=A0A409YW59_9AGAR|nr:hypothetical protein CVT24_010056 [Panaeolus cyanescens]
MSDNPQYSVNYKELCSRAAREEVNSAIQRAAELAIKIDDVVKTVNKHHAAYNSLAIHVMMLIGTYYWNHKQQLEVSGISAITDGLVKLLKRIHKTVKRRTGSAKWFFISHLFRKTSTVVDKLNSKLKQQDTLQSSYNQPSLRAQIRVEDLPVDLWNIHDTLGNEPDPLTSTEPSLLNSYAMSSKAEELECECNSGVLSGGSPIPSLYLEDEPSILEDSVHDPAMDTSPQERRVQVRCSEWPEGSNGEEDQENCPTSKTNPPMSSRSMRGRSSPHRSASPQKAEEEHTSEVYGASSLH